MTPPPPLDTKWVFSFLGGLPTKKLIWGHFLIQ